MMHDDEDDRLIPDSKAAERYGICRRTIDRWDHTPELEFPRPIWINGRRYRRLPELQAWERARAAGKIEAA
jgi:predicted DNA-binding transcriptional regulator AlpA